jgi:hypothetical protein
MPFCGRRRSPAGPSRILGSRTDRHDPGSRGSGCSLLLACRAGHERIVTHERVTNGSSQQACGMVRHSNPSKVGHQRFVTVRRA